MMMMLSKMQELRFDSDNDNRSLQINPTPATSFKFKSPPRKESIPSIFMILFILFLFFVRKGLIRSIRKVTKKTIEVTPFRLQQEVQGDVQQHIQQVVNGIDQYMFDVFDRTQDRLFDELVNLTENNEEEGNIDEAIQVLLTEKNKNLIPKKFSKEVIINAYNKLYDDYDKSEDSELLQLDIALAVQSVTDYREEESNLEWTSQAVLKIKTQQHNNATNQNQYNEVELEPMDQIMQHWV